MTEVAMPWRRKEVIGDCTLYLGDCARILPLLARADAVVTDPPYGIGASAGTGKYGKLKFEATDKGWDGSAIGAPVIAQLLRAADEAIIWGGNYFTLPPSRAYLVWDKGAGFRGRDFAECEMAWWSRDSNARVMRYDPLAAGDYRDKLHPTQKPVAVMDWCLGFIPNARTILDPFMGSGTTGVSCVKAKRRFIGIEVDDGYFETACARIREACSTPSIFDLPPPARSAGPSWEYSGDIFGGVPE